MPKLFYITNDWVELTWYSTGGTRAKKYLQSPDGEFYYFKRSQYKEATATKPGKDFTYEFWSEVIAYEIGTLLGFNMLKYDVAIQGDIMGCISKSMINNEEEDLIEGVKYLQAFAPTYNPKDKTHQDRYTFHLIENSLENAKLKGMIADLLKVIVFDALIGNGDRHQENWAVITKQELFHEAIEKLEITPEYENSKKWLRLFLQLFKRIMKQAYEPYKIKNEKTPDVFYMQHSTFAPIYDSGSSLDRELLEEKVKLYLQSDIEINKYINKGLAEIHWQGQKISHFKLLENLLFNNLYKTILENVIYSVKENWNSSLIEKMVLNIDREVPETHAKYKIPDSRKQLIIKLITLRFKKLQALLHDRV
jgi:hypothetical protein